ncbi:MAG TPA: amidohydrolase family protein [Pseudomonas sp.]|uniref:amidohydrolase family protein n=1 Tax=Pseudomonas sp. TaxID=306 RepID=UPI002ED97CE2
MSVPHDSVVRSIALCLPPLDSVEPSRFSVPPGACDTHAHVVSASGDYPFSPDRSYTPPPAPEEKYLSMLNAMGMGRGVLVQISVYGTDNRYMLDVLSRHPDRLRGVAVVDANIDDVELQRLHDAGVRGVRLNVLFGGGVGFDIMDKLAARIAPLGWHMQFLMDIRQLPELMPRMSQLPCPVVIDHMGHMPVAEGMSHPGFQALLLQVRDHDWWVKLSGAYRISDQPDDYPDVTPWAQALVNAAPDRMLWGSDWPHVAIPKMVDTGRMLNLLADWVPDAAQRQKILVDNPARLYDFPPLRSRDA